jgi:hypothetical protein
VETLAANGQDVMAAEDMLSKPEIQRIFEQQYRDVVVDAVMPELESVASDRTSNRCRPKVCWNLSGAISGKVESI